MSHPLAWALALKSLPDAKLDTAKIFAWATVHNDAHIEAYGTHRCIVAQARTHCIAEIPETIRKGRTKHIAEIDKQDSSELPKKWETQFSATFNETHPSYGIPILIQRTEPIQSKAPYTSGAPGKKAYIERDVGAPPIGFNTPQFETRREEKRLR
jgi:hypothetical protein